MGQRRSTLPDCRAFLTQLSLDCYEICKAAVSGHYESDYFKNMEGVPVSKGSSIPITRLRAIIQDFNSEFAEIIERNGHKYQIYMENESLSTRTAPCPKYERLSSEIATDDPRKRSPKLLNKEQAITWVRTMLLQTRGRELIGNFNPLLIGELFWEQSTLWKLFAECHIKQIIYFCRRSLEIHLEAIAPDDVKSRVWACYHLPAIQSRGQAAYEELDKLIEDLKSFPINYNHYYSDTILKQRQDREASALKNNLERTLQNITPQRTGSTTQSMHVQKAAIINSVVASLSNIQEPDMEKFSCEEALDCLHAIYKVSVNVALAGKAHGT
jgi:hypothetical protein